MKSDKLNKELKEAKKSVLIAESILDSLVTLVFGPYLHIKAQKLKNSPEWRATERKIKELTKQAEELQDKADEAMADLLGDKLPKSSPTYKRLADKHKNTKGFKSTKPL